MHILIVDDAKLQRLNLVRILGGLGHTVDEADHGQTALDRIAGRRPDLVISDLLMPVMDGFALAEALRERHPGLPLVVCSADIQASSRERVDALGALAFLNKPIDRKGLAEVLGRIRA